MARIKAPCPFCETEIVPAREEVEETLVSGKSRREFVASICDRCWDAIMGVYDEKPVNEAEMLDGVR